MLNLKYLFDNKDLATMLLGNWDFDESSLELFKYFRISSNAVYPFKHNEKVHFLRFAPTSEKSMSNLMAEHDFINFLGEKQYPALKYVASKNARDIEVIKTPWGDYYASVFQRVPGNSLEEVDFTSEISRLYGQHLGLLHKLSTQYIPMTHAHWTFEDVLIWIESTLIPFEQEALAKKELLLVKEGLALLSKSQNTFGLIHYDFELDNVFYDAKDRLMSVIDFDDSMYGWFVMDIERALDSIENEIGGDCLPDLKASFITGYRDEFAVEQEMLSHMPLFKRFANLYSYTRVIHCTAETWANEPQWMVQLRNKLNYIMTIRSKDFGQQL